MGNQFTVKQIGRVRAGKEGFCIELAPEYKEALVGLEGFSYINIVWWFSGCDNGADRGALSETKPYTPSLDRVENPEQPAWCGHWPRNVESSGDFDWESEFNF